MRPLIVLLLIILITACAPTVPVATPQPTVEPLVGSVAIDFPQEGAVIYAESMYLSGTAADLPDNQFILKLVDTTDQGIAQTTITVNADGTWQTELLHGYNDEPTEITIMALPHYTGAPLNSDYTIQPVVLAANRYRPEGIFGSIVMPFEGDSVGGDVIPVSGTVSGVFENTFTLTLEAEDGTVLDTQMVTVTNPYFVDEVPWQAELSPGDYTGAAVIRAFALSPQDGEENPIGSVPVTIAQVAG